MYRKLFLTLTVLTLMGLTAGCSKSKSKDEVKVPVKIALLGRTKATIRGLELAEFSRPATK